MRKEQITDVSSPHAQSRYQKGVYGTFEYEKTVNERLNELKNIRQHTATKKEKMFVFPFLYQAPSISTIFDHIGGALLTNKLEHILCKFKLN